MKIRALTLKIISSLVILLFGFFGESSPLKKITFSQTFGGPNNDRAVWAKPVPDGGYIVIGQTSSLGAGQADLWVLRLDANGNKLWDKTFGGPAQDVAHSLALTKDGGYLIVGATKSFGAGNTDFWILKLNSKGEKEWEKFYGGEKAEVPRAIELTSDGGYIVVGGARSKGATKRDAKVIKLDQKGERVWEKNFGGNKADLARDVKLTKEGGYIIAGVSNSLGAGGADAYIIKLDSNGNKSWEKFFGGKQEDIANSIQVSSEGGFIVAGSTNSQGAGNKDLWVFKLDEKGSKIWEQTYGGASLDEANVIIQNPDGTYLVAGATLSSGKGSHDAWVLKLDKTGKKIWEKTYGGENYDYACSIQATKEQGYIIAGYTRSFGAGNDDVWIILIDENGNCTGQGCP